MVYGVCTVIYEIFPVFKKVIIPDFLALIKFGFPVFILFFYPVFYEKLAFRLIRVNTGFHFWEHNTTSSI